MEVEAEYSRDDLTVRVRDDNRGIAPPIADEGHPGHFGLPGMREDRADPRGAAVLKSRGRRTEVEIHVPAKTAPTERVAGPPRALVAPLSRNPRFLTDADMAHQNSFTSTVRRM